MLTSSLFRFDHVFDPEFACLQTLSEVVNLTCINGSSFFLYLFQTFIECSLIQVASEDESVAFGLRSQEWPHCIVSILL